MGMIESRSSNVILLVAMLNWRGPILSAVLIALKGRSGKSEVIRMGTSRGRTTLDGTCSIGGRSKVWRILISTCSIMDEKSIEGLLKVIEFIRQFECKIT